MMFSAAYEWGLWVSIGVLEMSSAADGVNDAL